MKKKQEVEVRYVKLQTTFIIAVVCIVAGFSAGLLYHSLDGGSSGTVRKVENTQSPAVGNSQLTQQLNSIAILENQIKNDPAKASNWLQLGNLYFDTNQPANAIRSYKKYLELSPDNPDVWTDMGVMHRRNNEPQLAINAFDRAQAVNPRHEPSLFNKGIVLRYDLNKRDEAKKVWQVLLKLNPQATAPNGQFIRDLINQL